MRNAAIHLRALPQQFVLIDQAAQLLDKTRAEFMVDAGCDKAQSVLLDQVFSIWRRQVAGVDGLAGCAGASQPRP